MARINGKKAFVGLSGGVDSSVSAALLKRAGYDVTGVFIKVWQPDWIECTWKEDRRDAMRVAAALDIPFITLDLEKEYKEGVIDYMIAEYRAGRTPNPDVMCNKEVKFGAFYDWAMAQGADYVATGHYAQIRFDSSKEKEVYVLSKRPSERAQAIQQNRASGPSENEARLQQKPTPFAEGAHTPPSLTYKLCKGADSNKDQSYFLWTLKQEQLGHILFPIGHLEKPQVRRLAHKFKLPTAEKKDSQGLCFIGKIDFKDFLSHYLKLEEGNVLDEQGEIIGTHPGSLLFTIGERHGFSVRKSTPNDAPLYVIDKDVERNTITVSTRTAVTATRTGETARLTSVNWIAGSAPDFATDSNSPHLPAFPLQARSRYRQELGAIRITSISISETEIEFEKPQTVITPGQSLVIYDGEACLGGGVIQD